MTDAELKATCDKIQRAGKFKLESRTLFREALESGMALLGGDKEKLTNARREEGIANRFVNELQVNLHDASREQMIETIRVFLEM